MGDPEKTDCMDYYPIIAANFQRTIETISLSVDALAAPLARGSELMVQALLQDRKIVTCGNGVDAALGQIFSAVLLNHCEQERPALPALALGSDSASLTAIAQSSGLNEVFSRQLRALGQPGDVLLCISSAGVAQNLLRAVQSAHELGMGVVALTHAGDRALGALIREEDVEVAIEAPRQPQVLALHTMAVQCLCQLIDCSLFGTYRE